MRIPARVRHRAGQPRAVAARVAYRIEPDPLPGSPDSREQGAALRVGDGREVDGEVRSRPGGPGGADHAQEIPGVGDPNLVGPRLPQDRCGILAAYDQGHARAGPLLAYRADGGHVEEQVSELVLGAIEMDPARRFDQSRHRIGRGAAGAQILVGPPGFGFRRSNSSTLTRRSWQAAGISGWSVWR